MFFITNDSRRDIGRLSAYTSDSRVKVMYKYLAECGRDVHCHVSVALPRKLKTRNLEKSTDDAVQTTKA